jgi:hypothetical protein
VITPGQLLELQPTGYRRNTVTGQAVAKVFALERDELGKDIDQTYAVGDKVKVGAFHAGQRVYAFLASGENVAKGAYLGPDGTGLLVAAAGGDEVATALEAVNALVTTRIRVELV